MFDGKISPIDIDEMIKQGKNTILDSVTNKIEESLKVFQIVYKDLYL